MKKLILFAAMLAAFAVCKAQMNTVYDTAYTPLVASDTIHHLYGLGYTDQISGVMLDCRAVAADDSTGFRVNIGTGWAAYDTTFIQFAVSSTNQSALPAVLSGEDDYLIGFEKVGQAFSWPRLQITGGSAAGAIAIPIKITYDR